MGDSFRAALCAGQRRNLPPHKKVLGEGEGLGGREGEAACPLYGGSPERFLPSPKRESTLLLDGYIKDPHALASRATKLLEQASAWYADVKKL